ncbi:LysR family substrate-binding domain-containing protein [Streptosporangium lutulentum]
MLSRAMVLLPAARELQEEAVRFANASVDVTRYRLGATNGPILGGLVDRLATAWPTAPVTTHTSWSAKELTTMVMLGRIDFAIIGACGESSPPVEGPVAWLTVGTDPVFVLLNEDHPLAEKKEVALADLADEQWTVTPGDSCFGDCFATACARAGFTPKTIYETDVATCMHLAQVGRAVALCQATFQPAEGLALVPLTGARCAGGSCSAGIPRRPPPGSSRRSSSTRRPPTPTRYGGAGDMPSGWPTTPGSAPLRDLTISP